MHKTWSLNCCFVSLNIILNVDKKNIFLQSNKKKFNNFFPPKRLKHCFYNYICCSFVFIVKKTYKWYIIKKFGWKKHTYNLLADMPGVAREISKTKQILNFEKVSANSVPAVWSAIANIWTESFIKKIYIYIIEGDWIL